MMFYGLYVISLCSLCPGATTAPSLIFILPGLFYIRIIPTDQEPMKSRPKIQVSSWLTTLTSVTSRRTVGTKTHLCFLGGMFHSIRFHLHDHESDLHRNRLDKWRKAKSWWTLVQTLRHLSKLKKLLPFLTRTQQSRTKTNGKRFWDLFLLINAQLTSVVLRCNQPRLINRSHHQGLTITGWILQGSIFTTVAAKLRTGPSFAHYYLQGKA